MSTLQTGLQYFSLSFQPVTEVILLCGVGACLANPRVNLFPLAAREFVNKLVVVVFLPALIFSKLGEAVTFDKIITWWYMPINIVVITVIGAGVGFLVVRICKTPQKFKRLAIVCCGIGNIGNLPLVLIYGLCSDPKNPFGAEAECRKQGVAYVTYGMWMAVIMTWTVAYNFLKPSNFEEETSDVCFPPITTLPCSGNHPSDGFSVVTEQGKVVNGGKQTSEIPSRQGSFEGGLRVNEGDGGEETIWNVKQDSKTNSNPGQESEKFFTTDVEMSSVAELQLLNGRNGVQQEEGWVDLQSSRWSSFSFKSIDLCSHFNTCASKWHLKDIFTPPTSAALTALVVGSIPFLKTLFFGDNAPFRILIRVADILGGAMIPSMMLVLGGNLSEGPTRTDIGFCTIAGISFTRLLLVPFIGLFLIPLVNLLGWVPKQDPMFKFVLLLQFGMPSAINIGTIAQLHGSGHKEASAILFWEYVLCGLPLTLFLSATFAILF